MAQATSDPPEIKMCLLLKDGFTSSDLRAQFLCLNMSLASNSTGKRRSELGRKWGEEKASWKWQGLIPFFGFSWLWADSSSPH